MDENITYEDRASYGEITTCQLCEAPLVSGETHWVGDPNAPGYELLIGSGCLEVHGRVSRA